MILKCSCQHEGQDELNGKGMRVCCPNKDGTKLHCTVCGKEHQGSERKK
jgi:hypothetical protein